VTWQTKPKDGNQVMALEQETATFQRELPRLLQRDSNRGQYALVHGGSVDSIWDTEEKALEEGYTRFGLEPFLVQQITEHEEPKFFSRNLKRCQ
jgi:hypothetical protein